jgi:predicted helicase
MELHIDYEKQPEYKLEELEDPKAEFGFRVERMKLSKDKPELRYNDFSPSAASHPPPSTTASATAPPLSGSSTNTESPAVPAPDPRSGIVNDPNRPDDPRYILRLIREVITVSLETQTLIRALPSLQLPA